MNLPLILVGLTLCIRILSATSPCEFVILIASYNNEKWVYDNLKSVCHQKSSNPYQVICINDCSTDKTGDLMNQYVKKHNLESYVTLIHNPQRRGACENIYNAIHQLIPDHKIVVQVDGDDCLAHDEVLLTLEKHYANPDVWLTYGSTTVIPVPSKNPKSRRIPNWVFETKQIRKYKFVSQHLRTFKAWLFKKVNVNDLMYQNQFLSMSSDMAYLFPMLEMGEPVKKGDINHSAFIPEILYIYRHDNPINDFRVNKKFQKQLAHHIRNLPPYEPISDHSK